MYDPDRLKQIWTTPRPVLDILDRVLTGPGPFWTASGQILDVLDRTWTGLDRIWTSPGPVWTVSRPTSSGELQINNYKV